MVKYNMGRFLFMFDPITEEVVCIYDRDYSAAYVKNHLAFNQVFKIAIDTLDEEALEELKGKVKDEPKLKQSIEKVIFNRNNNK